MPSNEKSWHIHPGDPDSDVIVHVPHASRAIPIEERSRIVLDDEQLERELDAITDAHTDRIALAAAERSGRRPWLMINRYSRLLVDPERFPDEREEMTRRGMGAVYVSTTGCEKLRDPNPADDERLLQTYYWPYAEAMAELVQGRLEATGSALIIDLHSFPPDPLPYEMHKDQARPTLCIGTDPFHTPEATVRAVEDAWTGSTSRNEPFGDTYVPLRFHRQDERVRSLMLEIRRDVVDDWAAGSNADPADRLVDLVTSLAGS